MTLGQKIVNRIGLNMSHASIWCETPANHWSLALRKENYRSAETMAIGDAIIARCNDTLQWIDDGRRGVDKYGRAAGWPVRNWRWM